MPKIYRLLSNVAFLFAKSQIVKTPNDNLLILDNNKSLHFDCQIKLFFFNRGCSNYSMYACHVTQNLFLSSCNFKHVYPYAELDLSKRVFFRVKLHKLILFHFQQN